MITDLYIRNENDPYYRPDILETTTEEEALVNQVRMTLGTTRSSVLGEPGYGINLMDFLYLYDVDPNSISNEMNEQLNTYSELVRIYNVDIDIKKVTTSDNKDAILADMRINGKNVLGFLV